MIGASGALFAIIAAGGAMQLQVWRADLVFFQMSLRLDLRLATIVLCALELLQMLFHQLGEVAHVAHLAGALVGFLFGLLVRRLR